MHEVSGNHAPSDVWLSAFEKIKRPLVVTHVTPDADAIGSALGLATAMRERGFDASLGLPRKTVANKLEFLLALAPDTPIDDEWNPANGYDAVLILDTASEKRINLEPKIKAADGLVRFVLDHHVSNPGFGDQNWIDASATSTCEMVGRLLPQLSWQISGRVASLLYAGLHSDTMGFSLASTTAASLETAANMIRAGAQVGNIVEQLSRSQARSDFELLRRVYDNTTLTADGQIAYSFLTHKDFDEAGAKAEDIDDQVTVPFSLKGVRMAMLFTEGDAGKVRINFRSEGNVTVIELAQQFGGGGHAQAAGVRFSGRDVHSVIEEVVAAAKEQLARQVG